ncbi:MAG: toll/interleukin-1 receptor domain-containing protein [Acidobacteriaceae bacterium]
MSYSRHDEALVKPLAGLLGVAADDAVFLDVTSLRPGDRWDDKIIGAVKDSSVFVLCWCCEGKNSEFIAKEISAALLEGGRKLVPVLFCSTPLPASMAERQWIDLRGKVVHDCPIPHLSNQEAGTTSGAVRNPKKPPNPRYPMHPNSMANPNNPLNPNNPMHPSSARNRNGPPSYGNPKSTLSIGDKAAVIGIIATGLACLIGVIFLGMYFGLVSHFVAGKVRSIHLRQTISVTMALLLVLGASFLTSRWKRRDPDVVAKTAATISDYFYSLARK